MSYKFVGKHLSIFFFHWFSLHFRENFNLCKNVIEHNRALLFLLQQRVAKKAARKRNLDIRWLCPGPSIVVRMTRRGHMCATSWQKLPRSTLQSLRTGGQRQSTLDSLENSSTILHRCKTNHSQQLQTSAASSPCGPGCSRHFFYTYGHWYYLRRSSK